jgi:mRNA interferase RelE/StbE
LTNLTWSIEWTPDSKKQLLKLDRPIQKRILTFLARRVLPSDNPRQYGKKLTGNLSAFWSYRVGDYRIITDIKDNQLIILVVQLDHRRQVYDC